MLFVVLIYFPLAQIKSPLGNTFFEVNRREVNISESDYMPKYALIRFSSGWRIYFPNLGRGGNWVVLSGVYMLLYYRARTFTFISILLSSFDSCTPPNCSILPTHAENRFSFFLCPAGPIQHMLQEQRHDGRLQAGEVQHRRAVVAELWRRERWRRWQGLCCCCQ